MSNLKSVLYYSSILKKNKEQIRRELTVEPAICSIGGSISVGLSNKTSDIDVYVIATDTSKIDGYVHKKIMLGNTVFDFMCINISACRKACEDYIALPHKYPTCCFRSKKETEKIQKTRDLDRKDFPREMIARIYASEVIVEFIDGIAQKYHNMLIGGMTVSQIWDAYYCRAYGNYKESLRDNMTPLVRKYLYTVLELMICDYINQKRDIILDFKGLIYKYNMPDNCRDAILKLFDTNLSADAKKEKLYTALNIDMNKWIENELELIRNNFINQDDIIPLHKTI